VSDFRNYIRKASGKESFDLVFIDPPYAMKCCKDAALLLAKSGLLLPGAIVCLESGEEVIDTDSPELSDFEVIKSSSYGKKSSVNILLYRKEA
jgi:16S rRNA G966 N2-methylase RsmD